MVIIQFLYHFYYLFSDEELLIERSIHKGVINPGEEKQTVEYKSSSTASLEYTIRVRCDEHYYGSKCNKVCRPRDDYFGHYVCDQVGNRECMEGWTNLTSSCKTGTEKVVDYTVCTKKKGFEISYSSFPFPFHKAPDVFVLLLIHSMYLL